MFTLLHGYYKYLTQKDEFCVLILGLDNAGKTVIIHLLNTKCINIVPSRFLTTYVF